MVFGWLPALQQYNTRLDKIDTKCHWNLHGLWLNHHLQCGCVFEAAPYLRGYVDPEDQLKRELDILMAKEKNNNNRLRKQVYRKHGSGFVSFNTFYGGLGISNSNQYFTKATQLLRKHDIGVWLKNDFKLNESFRLSKLSDTIKTKTGKLPFIQCYNGSGPTNIEDASMVNEIRLCFDKKWKFIDCEVDKHWYNREDNDVKYLSTHDGNSIFLKPYVGSQMMPLPPKEITPQKLATYCADTEATSEARACEAGPSEAGPSKVQPVPKKQK